MAKISPDPTPPETFETQKTHQTCHLIIDSNPLPNAKSVFADSGRHTNRSREQGPNDRTPAVREPARLRDEKSFEIVKNSPVQIAPTTHETHETHRNDRLNTSSGPLPSTESVFADSGRHNYLDCCLRLFPNGREVTLAKNCIPHRVDFIHTHKIVTI